MSMQVVDCDFDYKLKKLALNVFVAFLPDLSPVLNMLPVLASKNTRRCKHRTKRLFTKLRSC